MAKDIRTDCRYFLGDRPCDRGGECEGCERYSPMGTRILVIKLAAAGDVLRTTSILPPLKRAYPESHVTWVTEAAAVPLLAHNPYLDRVFTFGFDAWLKLSAQSFDVLICLDKDERACALASILAADKKLGFAMSCHGTVEPLNESARYDYELGLSNEEKFFGNEKVYPEIFCDTAGLGYEGEPYMLVLPDSSIRYAQEFMSGLAPEGPVVGLNVGAGRVFANKAWTSEGLAALARWIRSELGGTALVLGGPEDRGAAERVLQLADGAAADGGTHDVLDFAAIVGMLDAVVTGDTLALHIAVALGVPTVALFGPSAPQEIELYGRGRKVVTPLDCSPCYLRSCDKDPSCMDSIEVETVSKALREVLELE
jgi:ADP-heptose:LPS heptosyltransferase